MHGSCHSCPFRTVDRADTQADRSPTQTQASERNVGLDQRTSDLVRKTAGKKKLASYLSYNSFVASLELVKPVGFGLRM